MRRFTFALFIAFAVVAQEPPTAFITDYFKASIGPVPEELKLDPFYKKYTSALASRWSVRKNRLTWRYSWRETSSYTCCRSVPTFREAMIAKHYRVVVNGDN